MSKYEDAIGLMEECYGDCAFYVPTDAKEKIKLCKLKITTKFMFV